MSTIRVNLRNQYVSLYGHDIANKIRRLEDLHTKRARYTTSLNFLKRCRDHGLIPKCVKLSARNDIQGSAKILNQASTKLLRALIHQNRSDLRQINHNINVAYEFLQTKVSTFDFNNCIETFNKRENKKYETCKNRQIKKFENLASKSNVRNDTSTKNGTRPFDANQSRAVVNLSSQTLDNNTINALKKGLNFAIAPCRIPYEDIICNVEDCLAKNNIVKEDSEAIRQDISSVLRRSKLPTPNLPKPEIIALKELRNRPELTVLRADKGNATVVMNTSDYNDKIQELLSDESTYKLVKTDPTNKILKSTTVLVKKHSEALNLDVKALIPTCIKPPKLYGLPKIHKPNAPLRPIVSQIDTPTYKLAQHVARLLSQLRGKTRAHVKDSYQFVGEIKDLKLADNEIMVSFDVQSLFTCIPVQDCIEIVLRKLEENDLPLEYADLLRQCLTTGYLLWNNQFYMQIDGVAMGSPVSPVVADIFMEDFEEKALKTAPVTPRFYKRYVDDTFTILPSDQTTAFLNHLNSIHPNIKFTMESEANQSLAFLDVLVIHNPDHSLSHTVYRKATHTDRYLNGDSHHHPTQLSTVGKTLFQRAHGICDKKHLATELQHVKQVLQENKLRAPRQHRRTRAKAATVERLPAILPYMRGVTDKIGYILKRASIKTFFKPPKKISQLLPSVKCHIPLQDPGVYKLDCDCGLSYIGQTKRNIGTRVKEHIADMKHRRHTKSAVCEHTLDKTNHYIRFDNPQILAKEHRFRPRMIREAIEIRKYPNFNREDGWKVPPAWDPIIRVIKSQAKRQNVKQPDTVSSLCVPH